LSWLWQGSLRVLKVVWQPQHDQTEQPYVTLSPRIDSTEKENFGLDIGPYFHKSKSPSFYSQLKLPHHPRFQFQVTTVRQWGRFIKQSI
jgi:hypothetical protein